MGFLSEDGRSMDTPEVVAINQDLHPAGRFSMKRVSAIFRGGFNCGSINLVDLIGPKAKANLDILEGVAHVIDG